MLKDRKRLSIHYYLTNPNFHEGKVKDPTFRNNTYHTVVSPPSIIHDYCVSTCSDRRSYGKIKKDRWAHQASAMQ